MWNSSLSVAVNLLQTEERKRCKMNQGRSQYGMGKSAKTWENGFHGSIKALNLSIWTWKVRHAFVIYQFITETLMTKAAVKLCQLCQILLSNLGFLKRCESL